MVGVNLGKPYSSDLRTRFVSLLNSGFPASTTGSGDRKVGVCPSHGGDHKSAVLEAHAENILSMMHEQPDIFSYEIVEALTSTLKPGDIVICDNLNIHTNAEAAKTIRAQGAELLFLPPYSPDLNPIERLFAKNIGCRQTSRSPNHGETRMRFEGSMRGCLSQGMCKRHQTFGV